MEGMETGQTKSRCDLYYFMPIIFYFIDENDFIFTDESCFELEPQPECSEGCSFLKSLEQCASRDGQIAEPEDGDTFGMVNLYKGLVYFHGFHLFSCWRLQVTTVTFTGL